MPVTSTSTAAAWSSKLGAARWIGMERVALALFKHHGLDVQDWPQSVRKVLWS